MVSITPANRAQLLGSNLRGLLGNSAVIKERGMRNFSAWALRHLIAKAADGPRLTSKFDLGKKSLQDLSDIFARKESVFAPLFTAQFDGLIQFFSLGNAALDLENLSPAVEGCLLFFTGLLDEATTSLQQLQSEPDNELREESVLKLASGIQEFRLLHDGFLETFINDHFSELTEGAVGHFMDISTRLATAEEGLTKEVQAIEIRRNGRKTKIQRVAPSLPGQPEGIQKAKPSEISASSASTALRDLQSFADEVEKVKAELYTSNRIDIKNQYSEGLSFDLYTYFWDMHGTREKTISALLRRVAKYEEIKKTLPTELSDDDREIVEFYEHHIRALRAFAVDLETEKAYLWELEKRVFISAPKNLPPGRERPDRWIPKTLALNEDPQKIRWAATLPVPDLLAVHRLPELILLASDDVVYERHPGVFEQWDYLRHKVRLLAEELGLTESDTADYVRMVERLFIPSDDARDDAAIISRFNAMRIRILNLIIDKYGFGIPNLSLSPAKMKHFLDAYNALETVAGTARAPKNPRENLLMYLSEYLAFINRFKKSGRFDLMDEWMDAMGLQRLNGIPDADADVLASALITEGEETTPTTWRSWLDDAFILSLPEASYLFLGPDLPPAHKESLAAQLRYPSNAADKKVSLPFSDSFIRKKIEYVARKRGSHLVAVREITDPKTHEMWPLKWVSRMKTLSDRPSFILDILKSIYEETKKGDLNVSKLWSESVHLLLETEDETREGLERALSRWVISKLPYSLHLIRFAWDALVTTPEATPS